MIWEVQIAYVVIDKNGNDKTVKNNFIIHDCETFSEVEYMVTLEFGTRAGFDIVSIKRSRLREIANARSHEDDKIWVADIMEDFYNDDGEKKTMQYKIAYFERGFDEAKSFIADFLKQGYDGLVLSGLKLTKFCDIL